MAHIITVTEMARSFSDIIARVDYKGEVFEIKKGVNVVAKLTPVQKKSTISVKNLNDLFLNAPHLDEGDVTQFTKDIEKIRSLKDEVGF